jgi:membrane-associated protease RseP (regulator of RpoE activity)
MMTVGILAFVVALLVSVMIHEAGHFVTARMFGMKATQFFVGFGPTLWSRQRGETEYGIKAIPAGGFVKIIGMTPLEEIDPKDQPRALINKPGWQRFIVLVAGSAMHFVIAILLFLVLVMFWATKPTGYATVGQVYACAVPDSNGQCAAGATPAPAAGVLQQGDVILAVNGHNVKTTSAVLHDPSLPTAGQQVKGGSDGVVALTRAAGKGSVTFTVQRDGVVRQLTFTPVIGPNGFPRIGFEPLDQLGHAGPAGALSMFGQTITGSFAALGQVPHELSQILDHPNQHRQIGGSGAQVTSVVGVAHIAGDAFRSGGLSGGVATLIAIVASVNLFVGIFNLFPLLPLDGGHIAILGYEKTRDWWRRRQGRPAGGPVDLTKLMPVTYAALALIVGVSAILLYADVVNPVTLPQ